MESQKTYPYAGFESVQGRRWNMEDAHVILDDLGSVIGTETDKKKRMSFYAVYDGHGGRNAARIAEEMLHKFLVEEEEFKKGNIPKALRIAYSKTDKLIMERAVAEQWADGSTAVTVALLDSKLYIANVGDSEAVLGRRKTDKTPGWDHVLLSERHTPNEEREKDRLGKVGCLVAQGRVMGVLAVSRSLGDLEFKAPHNQKEFDYVISEPFVASIDLIELDDFVIIACDGLWDTLSYADAVEIVATARWNGKSAYQAAENLVKEALDRRTMDNVTVLTPPQKVFLILPGNCGLSTAAFQSINSHFRYRQEASALQFLRL